ncbi:MAG: hypothetical protein C5B50_01040 [Verrucomicrobia bacterium]|nr:MAG: hypothetical protein C5B50_01040 [Verrucomicrobiota bacterium]
MLPSQFLKLTPSTPDEFIGPAGAIAKLLQRAVKDSTAAGKTPLTVLFNGPPGIGKSALARYLIGLLGSDKWSVKKYSGNDVNIDTVRDIAADLHYKDLFGNWRVLWIEEADLIPAAAQNRFLMLLDDLPQGCAVICTSNCKVDDFQKRFQTRFKIYDVEPPQPQEIENLLRRWLTRPQDLKNISIMSCGCVRQALLDAETCLQAAA